MTDKGSGQVVWGLEMPQWVVEIAGERKRQDGKFGVETMSDERWLAVLVEEVGEVARAILEGDGLDEELVQVAAVCVAWRESRRGEVAVGD